MHIRTRYTGWHTGQWRMPSFIASPRSMEHATALPLAAQRGHAPAGVAEVALTLEPHLRNRAGKLHGGAIFSLVDITMGLACSSAHGFDRQSATIECKINYIRAVSDGEVLCTARVIHPGRRTLVVEADVRPADIAFIYPGQKAIVRISAFDFFHFPVYVLLLL